jgi:penicillin-binding protein 1A
VRRRRSFFLKFFIFLLMIVLSITLLLTGFALAVVREYSQNLPDVEKLRSYEPSQTTKIFSADGELIGSLYKEDRTWIPLERIPRDFKNAILAIEDSRFYEHRGVDIVGLARAAFINYRGGTQRQGASTITQQLARNIFLTPEATVTRKIKEALLALQIERTFSKDEILELYLNQIYFGHGAHGIEAAAENYFGKKAEDLTLGESALLAGLPKAPSEYFPQEAQGIPKSAKQRQILVIYRMQSLGFITHRQAKRAMNETLRYRPMTRSEFSFLKYPYFTSYVLQELFQKYDEDILYRGGLRVYTSLDTRLQSMAQKVLKEGVEAAKGYNCRQGALVSLDPATGFIRAMVGGVEFTSTDQFNRAWQARRQPGSSFKVFVYTAAIDSGFSPYSVVVDGPFTLRDGAKGWSPKNDDRKFNGPMTFKDALRWSKNVCAVKVGLMVGVEKVKEYAYRMGIKEKIIAVPSLPLGTCEVTPLQMASAFGVLANGGVRVEPTSIKMIKDSEGNIVEDHMFPHEEQVLPESTALIMTDMMRAVIEAGTGRNAYIGRPAAGKTGTTDNHKDAWFVGFTPELSTAVWVGNDTGRMVSGAYGGKISARIWGTFMKEALAGKPVHKFGARRGKLVPVQFCKETDRRALPTCLATYTKYCKAEEIPTTYCTRHASANSVPGLNTLDKKEKQSPTPEEETPVEEPAVDEGSGPRPEMGPAPKPAESPAGTGTPVPAQSGAPPATPAAPPAPTPEQPTQPSPETRPAPEERPAPEQRPAPEERPAPEQRPAPGESGPPPAPKEPPASPAP